MISTVACGFTKFAVPTATAVAPASMNSTASVAHEMPPMPSSGTSTALRTSHTMRSATGFTAGPDRPPTPRASCGAAALRVDGHAEQRVDERERVGAGGHGGARDLGRRR